MTVRIRRTPEQEAEDIANANLHKMQEEMLRKVGSRMRADGKPLDRHDLEGAYNAGWQNVTRHIIKGRPVTSLEGLLYVAVHCRAKDIWREKKEARRVDMDLAEQGIEHDLAAQVDDQDKLTRLLHRLRHRLNDKERKALTLCTLHGYTRPEAGDLLGIEHEQFQRIMDSATKKMAFVVASIEARGCGDDEWSRLMYSFALGLLSEDEPDYQRALAHIEGDDPCDACRRYVRGLRGLAAVLPPLLPPGLLDSHDTAHVLGNLARWLGSGHAPAAMQLAAGAGAGASGGTAVGAAVGGAKAILLAGAAAVTVSVGAAAVIATQSTGGHARSGPPHTSRVKSSDLDPAAPALGAAFDGRRATAHTGATANEQRARTRRRSRAAQEFAAQQPARHEEGPRRPEFTWEHERTVDPAPQSATTATAGETPTPKPSASTQHETSPREGENFSFEK